MVHGGADAGGVVAADVFRPPRALGVIVGAGFTLWAAFIALLAGVVAAGGGIEFTTFLAWVVFALFVGLVLAFGWWTLGLARLAYEVDDRALRIRWCGGEVIVPIADIRRIEPGRTLGEAPVSGLTWWGCRIGRGMVPQLGPTLFFTTHGAPGDNVYVVTQERSYALTTPDQVALFAEACSRRLIAGLEPEEPQRVEPGGLGALPFWRDRAVWLALTLALGGLGALGGYLFSQYPDLPALVQIDFPRTASIVRVGERSELLQAGAVAGAIAAINLVLGFFLHARERAAGVWLFASAALLQGVLLAAAVVAFARA